jgi:hypothetical protein
MGKRKLQKAALAILTLTIIATSSLSEPAFSQTAFQTIRILLDGTIDPASTEIQRVGDNYIFTGDVYAGIVVERPNIVIDGAGYALNGPYNGTGEDQWIVGQGLENAPDNESLWTTGIDFDVVAKPNNVTIKNVNIRNFYIGMYIWTFNNTVANNSVTQNIVGILLSGDSNTIARNYIAENDEGLFYGANNPSNAPLNTVLTGNSFMNNTVQFSGCGCGEFIETEPVHMWDDGERGNFWSNYEGTDTNGDGIGDAPYIIDIKNQDRYPLMQNMLTPPTPKLPLEIIMVAALAVVALVVALLVFKRKTEQKRLENQGTLREP